MTAACLIHVTSTWRTTHECEALVSREIFVSGCNAEAHEKYVPPEEDTKYPTCKELCFRLYQFRMQGADGMLTKGWRHTRLVQKLGGGGGE